MNPGLNPVPKFLLGRIMQTSGALGTLDPRSKLLALARHAAGDWGDIDAHDRAVNENSFKNGGTLVSIYKDSRGVRFYVITEHDRSGTNVELHISDIMLSLQKC